MVGGIGNLNNKGNPIIPANAPKYFKKTSEVDTEHPINPVPIFLVGKKYKQLKIKNGKLSDVVPTLLKMMNLTKHKDMTGKALF